MSLDLTVRYYSESKIDKSKYVDALLGEYYDDEDEEEYLDNYSVTLDYRLVISAIAEESRLMNVQLNSPSILSLLTCYEGWSGFNGESYIISNTGDALLFESGEYDEGKVIAELKGDDLQRYKEDVYRTYEELEKYLQTDSNDYIASKNFVILEMLKDLLENKESRLYADFD
ncbi:hypothetical protein [Sulfurimonas microaerophilic]|uniref:hypothetical protein n=1 Tax=Sulfurimonas microaerophilic TaxID=3058392 RepID=UPI002714E9CE|nr:hypothetical protein [Sulfurimonas sp. hsl 1-7]